MSFDMPDDPHSRDAALARLLADALKSQSKLAGHAKSTACPDAEVLATYAEHGLAEEETARWENHFADCDRCQKIIAALAATGEELTKAEVESLGNLAAASSAAREPVVRNTAVPWTAIWRRPALWRWLVPAVGMASAAALWLALHQAPPREASGSQKIAATSGAPQGRIDQGTTAASSAKPGETQIAQANLPTPLAGSPPSGALQRNKETAQANSSVATKQEPARKQETFRSAAQAPQASEANGTLEAREESAKDKRNPSAPPAEQKSQTVDVLGAAPPVATAAAPSTSPSARNDERAAPQGLDSVSGAPAPTQLKALAQAASVAIVFASPDRTALWRVGPGGRIEHSTDQGQTWQPQTSGVTADLLAGAAPSEKIAWVVGRAGIIMRTEDGEHWQRIAPPSATQAVAASVPEPDWIGVEARDVLHATIISRDFRRFVTGNGGRTWVQE
jgi:hypothetical protein